MVLVEEKQVRTGVLVRELGWCEILLMHPSILRNCRLQHAILEYDIGYLGSDCSVLARAWECELGFPLTTVMVPTSGKLGFFENLVLQLLLKIP